MLHTSQYEIYDTNTYWWHPCTTDPPSLCSWQDTRRSNNSYKRTIDTNPRTSHCNTTFPALRLHTLNHIANFPNNKTLTHKRPTTSHLHTPTDRPPLARPLRHSPLPRTLPPRQTSRHNLPFPPLPLQHSAGGPARLPNRPSHYHNHNCSPLLGRRYDNARRRLHHK